MELRGRCIRITPETWTLLDTEGQAHVFPFEEGMKLGDLVIRSPQGASRVLRSAKDPSRLRWTERIGHARRRRGLETRARILRETRAHFDAEGFLEVRTPALVPCPGMEPHIRPIRVNAEVALPTSPEFAMKKLLVGGLPRIYQIGPAFRDEPRSPQHSPEFTMLEFYRAFAGEEECLRDVELWIETLARRIHGAPHIPYQGRTLDVSAPWPRLTVRELFLKHAEVDLERADLKKECARLGLYPTANDTWDDLYHRIWLERVEPKLPFDRAVFVTRYPASQAALAEKDGFWARRFEAYLGGLELGNGFQELTDPDEQRARFEADMELRARTYGPEFPKTALDEEFLAALEEGMPPSSGIAIGMDRVVMLFADETEIDYTIAVPAHWPKK